MRWSFWPQAPPRLPLVSPIPSPRPPLPVSPPTSPPTLQSTHGAAPRRSSEQPCAKIKKPLSASERGWGEVRVRAGALSFPEDVLDIVEHHQDEQHPDNREADQLRGIDLFAVQSPAPQ